MNLRRKKTVFVVSTLLIMIVLFTIISMASFRYFSLDTVRSQSRMAAEMMRVALTEEMEKGLISERADLIARMRRVPGLADVHVVRGKPVIAQFGPGQESEKPRSPEEFEVLKTGKPKEVMPSGGNETYKVTIPFIASRFNDINCMNCHDVPEGTVNGAVTLTFSLEHQRNAALLAIAPIIGLLIIFGIALAYYLKRLLDPILDTTAEMQEAMGHAQQGDFSKRVQVRSQDEIGLVAERTNELIQTLEGGIGSISKKVEALSGQSGSKGQQRDLLSHTVQVVEEMVDATRFKREIEEDLDLNEVYQRIRRILIQRFGLKHFCLYEVSPDTKKLKQAFTEGMDDDSRDMWCDPTILCDAEICRAKRTAKLISSFDAPDICAAFRGQELDGKQGHHLCIPLMLSDRIGNVLQIVYNEEDERFLKISQDAIKAHIAVASTVIESKRLTQSLRESTMRDPMTGLYNRRFLEEFTENITSSIQRRGSSIGVLMCDVDFFKSVNDKYGHDVGDQVLKSLAKILTEAVRTSDMVVRYGGEEFLVLLIDTDEQRSLETAERIRSKMEEASFQTSTGPMKRTISIGVSLYPSDTDGFWQCVKYSDVSLYAAKEGGRNKVIRFTPDMWTEEDY